MYVTTVFSTEIKNKKNVKMITIKYSYQDSVNLTYPPKIQFGGVLFPFFGGT